MDFDLIDAINARAKKEKTILFPKEVIDRLKSGVQIHTILSVGESAFDDEPPPARDVMEPERQVITGRYPGHEMDMDPLVKDSQVTRVRMINCNEVHGIVALEDEEGADV